MPRLVSEEKKKNFPTFIRCLTEKAMTFPQAKSDLNNIFAYFRYF
jgi:hypothetical protein